MKKRMRSILFFLFLCASQFFECDSFRFGNLFRDNSYKPSPSSVQISPNKPSNYAPKQEDVDLDDNIVVTEYNVSISSLLEMLDNSSDSNWMLFSEVDNATEYVVASSSSVVEVPPIPVKNDESTTASSASTASNENTTQENDLLNVTQSSSFNTTTEEPEGVVLGTQAPSKFKLFTKTIYQKTIEWASDTYTLSILIPVAAGVLFATTIILTVVFCRCIRRCCRRRRFRKRVLPDSIKNLRPSDRARLLGDCDSSDEEF